MKPVHVLAGPARCAAGLTMFAFALAAPLACKTPAAVPPTPTPTQVSATQDSATQDSATQDSLPNAHHDGHAHHKHHRFDDAEQWAKQFDNPERDAWQRPDAVLDFIGLAPDARVADLGAGTGYFAMRMAKRTPQGRVFANDIEPDMVRYLGERADKEGLKNLQPVQGNASDPALPEAVDVVFLCNVFHHIEHRPAYFRKVAQRLRPGGRVVIVDFKKDAAADIPGPPPAMRIAQAALVDELAAAGLVLQRANRDLLPHQYIVELVVNNTGASQ